ADGFDWQVPGLRQELATALIKSLPKDLRRSFVPAPDTAREVLARIGDRAGRRQLTDEMADDLRRATGVVVRRDDWDLDRVPAHLRVTFRVEDDAGTAVDEGKDIESLRERLAPTVRRTVARAAADVERGGLTSWSFGDLPPTFEREHDGHRVKGFPALVDEGTSVALRVLGSAAEQERETRRGTRRLLTLTIPSPVKHVVGRLDNASKLALGHNPHGSVPALLGDCVDAAVDSLTARQDGRVTTAEAFEPLRDGVRAELPDAAYDVVRTVADILGAAHEVAGRVSGPAAPSVSASFADVREQLARLVRPGFVTATGRDRLPDVRRYLRAMQLRVDSLPHGAPRDQQRLGEVRQV
ncbi:MAG: DUF3418 domain-containing protein, partial [Actinomycetes bacterium]